MLSRLFALAHQQGIGGIAEFEAALFPTQFERRDGQTGGGGWSTPSGAIDSCFEIGRVKNLSSQHRSSADLQRECIAIFLGYNIQQFGHFITESLGRLPSAVSLDPEIPMYFLAGGPRSHQLQPWQTEFLRLIGIKNRIDVLRVPTYFQRLLVPPLHFHQNLQPFGDEVGRIWLSGLFQERATDKPEKIYVSRSKLPPKAGRFLDEILVETLLKAEGYTVIHPQEISIAEQIAHYSAAKKIIVAESSAVHLMNLCCKADQQIAIVQRRPKLHASLVRAISYSARSRMIGIDALRMFQAPEFGSSRAYHGIARLSLPKLGRILKRHDFISRSNEDFSRVERSALERLPKKYESYVNVRLEETRKPVRKLS